MADKRKLNDDDLSKISGAGAVDVSPSGGSGSLPGERGGPTGGTEPIDDPDGDADSTTGNNSDTPSDFNR